MAMIAHQFRPPDDPSDETDGTQRGRGGFPTEGDDLPYKVELWDDAGEIVEQLVAVSLSSSIGYAAYYAATREFVGRVVTLRHKGRVISRWAGRPH